MKGTAMPITRPIINVRGIKPDDLVAIMEIEKESFTSPWSKAEFDFALKRKNCTAIVATIGKVVAGFMVFEVFKKRIQILNMSVRSSMRRQGVATAMVNKLKDAVRIGTQPYIVAEVRESNLTAQLFFKSVKFKVKEIMPHYYKSEDNYQEDAYQFEYEISITT